MTKTRQSSVSARLEQNKKKAWEYLSKIVGTPYDWWTGGIVPSRAPAWGKNGPPPPAAEVRSTSCFCAGVPNLARRAVGLEIPHLGNENYDGGVVAYFGSTAAAAPEFPRRGYFEVRGKQRPFNLQEARRPWTLVGRKYRNVRDQGHVAIVLPGGKLLQSYDAGGGRPGVNTNVSLERSHFSWGPQGGYEVMVRPEDWLLPSGDAREKPEPKKPEPKPKQPQPKQSKLPAPKQPEPERPERKRPEPERPEPKRPVRPEPAVPLLTAKQLSEISGNADVATLQRYCDALVPEMQEAEISTHARITAFLGNVVQETDRLRTLEEYGGRSYWMYLDRISGRPGEWRYHGRGFLMNTWQDAYANLSQVLGVDLVSDPDLLTRPDLAARAATWFWTRHNLNSYADRGEFKKVCAIINTGSEWGEPNHLADRIYFYDRARSVIPRDAGARGRRDESLNRDGLPYINLAAVGQADETAAFALATEIRKAGVGVTVTNGAKNVNALAEIVYDEELGYRQMWILGQPALDACGDYGDLANWPISPETDYYDLAGRGFTGTCRRAAELADEKAKKGVGRRFLREMGMTKEASAKSQLPARAPSQDGAEKRKSIPDPDLPPRDLYVHREAHSRNGDDAPPQEEWDSPEEHAEAPDENREAALGALIDSLRNNKALITWFAGAAVTWLAGYGLLGEGDTDRMTTNFVTGILIVLGLFARQMTYGPVTVERKYRKKKEEE